MSVIQFTGESPKLINKFQYELLSIEDRLVRANEWHTIDTGVSITVADGYYTEITNTVGLLQKGLTVCNVQSISGRVNIYLKNHSGFNINIKPGQCIGYLTVKKIHSEIKSVAAEVTVEK